MAHSDLLIQLKELEKKNAILQQKNWSLRRKKNRGIKLCKALFELTISSNAIPDGDVDSKIPLINGPTALIRAHAEQNQKDNDDYARLSRPPRQCEYKEACSDSDSSETNLEEEKKRTNSLTEKDTRDSLCYGVSLPAFQPKENRNYSDFNFWKENYPAITDLDDLEPLGANDNDTKMSTNTTIKSKHDNKVTKTETQTKKKRNGKFRPSATSPVFKPALPQKIPDIISKSCKFFAYGYGKCYQGDSCRFAHELSPSLSPMLAPSPLMEASKGVFPSGQFSLDPAETLFSNPEVEKPLLQEEEIQKAITFWRDMGNKQLEQKQYDASAHSFSQVLSYKEDVDSYWKRGMIYRIQGNYYHKSRFPSLQQKSRILHNKAAQDFAEVIKNSFVKSIRASAYLCRADGFAKRGLWDMAMDDIKEHLEEMKGIKTKPQTGIMASLLNMNGYALRGDIHTVLKQKDKAIEDYKMAMKTDPANLEKYEQAIEALKKPETKDENEEKKQEKKKKR